MSTPSSWQWRIPRPDAPRAHLYLTNDYGTGGALCGVRAHPEQPTPREWLDADTYPRDTLGVARCKRCATYARYIGQPRLAHA